MPELPEVETTRRGILPHVVNQQVSQLIVRQKKLRWPISVQLIKQLPQSIISDVSRRGKYLLVHTDRGTLIIHLGMSGSLRVLTKNILAQKHDHVDLVLSDQTILRYTDPRRFGAWLWTNDPIFAHPLLKTLGPEPLGDDFDGNYLFNIARKRKITVKQFIMDSHVVVGVGNIYAAEALFLAGIHPAASVQKISLKKFQILTSCIRQILSHAIEVGGTTIRNFSDSDGKPGYFKQQLWVYGRDGQPCKKCKTILQAIKIGQRSSVFCPICQTK